jgi:hypothetical protein
LKSCREKPGEWIFAEKFLKYAVKIENGPIGGVLTSFI